VGLLVAALLGVLQGLTEFLPISSTAHLLIAERLVGFSDPDGVFTVMIQLGAILAIVWLYRRRLLDVLTGLPSDPAARHFAAMILVAFLPAAFAGAVLSKYVKQVLYASPAVIAWAFILGGVVILLVERLSPPAREDAADQTPLMRAGAIGVFQTLALVPGVSRSGATIVGARLLGLSRGAAAEFSFFLAIPTMTAAFAHDLWEVRHQLSPERGLEIAIGFVMAFVAAVLVVQPFLAYVKRSGFAPFAWYRIATGAAILVALGAGWL
jgi:undecaprenyl-diphosphatase